MNKGAATYGNIHDHQESLAKLSTEMHFQHHPALLAKFGKEGKEKCIQDSVFHFLYLAESVRTGHEEIFTGYLQWVAGMLAARHVPCGVLTDNLRYMGHACDTLLPAADLQLTQRYISNGLDRLSNLEPLPATWLTEYNPLREAAEQYLFLLLGGKRKEALALINELTNTGQTIPAIYEYVFAATQYEVGLLWQTNKITVAHEHYCTAATQMIMSSLYPYIFESKKKEAKLVACTIAGDYHEIGIRMVSDMFELDGWNTYYLGSGMPDVNILTALKEQAADVFALSVTMAYHVSRADKLIKKIRADKELNKLKILVGGYAFNIPGLWKDCGADGMANTASEAIDTANKMIA